MFLSRAFCIVSVLLISNFCFSQFTSQQQRTIDSLNQVINTLPEYSPQKGDAYHALGMILYVANTDTIIPLFGKALEIADSNLRRKNLSAKERKIILGYKADALHDITYAYALSGDYDQMIENYKVCYNLYKEVENTKYEAVCLNSIGYAYAAKKDFIPAIDYYKQSLTIMESLADEEGIATSYTNIGQIYNEMGDTTMALQNFRRGLNVFEKVEYKLGMATGNNNIGSVYYDKKNYPEALQYYFKSLDLYREIGDKEGILTSYNNIGAVFSKSYADSSMDEALSYYNRSLELAEEMESNYDVAYACSNIATTLYDMEKIAEAKKIALRGLELSEKFDFPSEKMEAFKVLSKIAKAEGDFKTSLDYFSRYTSLRDSIYNREVLGELARFEYEQRSKKDSVEFASIRTSLQEQLDKKQKESLFLWLGVTGLLVIGSVLFIRYRKAKIKKEQLEKEHRVIVEEKESIVQKIDQITKEYEPLELKTTGARLPLSQIEYIEANRNYVLVYTSDSTTPITERATFQDFISQLPSHQFVQIHRSFCINKYAVAHKLSRELIRMKSGKELKVSRSFSGNI